MSAEVADENPLNRKMWQIAGTGDLEQLEKLLNQGANVNAGDRTGVTALMRAAYHGQLTTVRALIEHGADPNAKDRSGLTALSMAKHGGHQEIVDALVSLGAETKKKVTTPRPVETLSEEGISPVTAQEATLSKTPEVRTLGTLSEQGISPVTSHEAKPSQTPEVRTFGTLSEKGVSPAIAHESPPSKSPEVRTLQEPPDIWHLVNTMQPESEPSSVIKWNGRSVREITRRMRVPPLSMRTLALGAAVVVVCVGVAFGLMAWLGTGNALEKPEQRAEAAELELKPGSNQRPSNAKAISDGRLGRVTLPAKDLTKVKSVGRLGEPTRQPAAVASAAPPAKKPSTKPRTEAIASFSRQNMHVRKTTRGETDQAANSRSAKKEQTPPPDDSVKPAVTQKPKVIQWP